MSTIPQRLRSLANVLQEGGLEMNASKLLEIASKLEAPPAADAVQARGIQEWADSPACAGLLLIRQRDHLAAVAALQARINELEARQVPEGEVHFIQGGKLVGKIINIGSQPDTSKEQP